MTFVRTALIAGLLVSAATPALARPQHHGQQHSSWQHVDRSHGHGWRQGQRLDRNQRRYVVNDWSHRGLSRPPRGYQWVRENNNSGDYLLVAAATGLIASILASH